MTLDGKRLGAGKRDAPARAKFTAARAGAQVVKLHHSAGAPGTEIELHLTLCQRCADRLNFHRGGYVDPTVQLRPAQFPVQPPEVESSRACEEHDAVQREG